jgi:hypothetical protein
MRVRVRFRYRAETGEVELYEVEDIGQGPREADHDARHDRAAAALARLVEDNALIEEGRAAEPLGRQRQPAPDEDKSSGRGGEQRERD